MGVYAQYGDLPNDIRSLKVILLRMCMCVRVCVLGGGGLSPKNYENFSRKVEYRIKRKFWIKGPKVFSKKVEGITKKLWYLSALFFWIQKGLSHIVLVFSWLGNTEWYKSSLWCLVKVEKVLDLLVEKFPLSGVLLCVGKSLLCATVMIGVTGSCNHVMSVCLPVKMCFRDRQFTYLVWIVVSSLIIYIWCG